MDNMKLWMLSLCGATAITAIFKILLSDSNLKKVINIFFSIFILFYILMPIKYFIKNDSQNVEFGHYEISSNELYVKGYEEIITKSIESICSKMSVNILNIQIDSYIDEEGFLYINSLEIDIDDNSRIFEIKSAINKQLGYEVIVK